MSLSIERHADASAFLTRALAWLMRAEAEHNLVLGLAYALVQGRANAGQAVYLATVQDGPDVAGCVFRTPPYKMGLTRMPMDAIPALVTDVAGVYDTLPAVLGPAAETQAFAEAWARQRGVHAEPGIRQRIYQLERVVPPTRVAPGHFQLAQRRHVELVAGWIRAFAKEAHMEEIRAEQIAADRIAAKMMFLWVDPEPVALAGWSGRSPNGIRIGPVYTPPESRGHGYASALVAAASQRALSSGAGLCFLYTDLDNRTSNAIYQRLGYEPVCDVLDWVFASSG